MIGEILKGMGTTLKHLFIPPVTTSTRGGAAGARAVQGPPRAEALRQWAGEVYRLLAAPPPARPTPSLWKRPRTATRSAIRPANAIALVYEINMLRCIFCGYCEDACPTEAIVLGHEYELS